MRLAKEYKTKQETESLLSLEVVRLMYYLFNFLWWMTKNEHMGMNHRHFNLSQHELHNVLLLTFSNMVCKVNLEPLGNKKYSCWLNYWTYIGIWVDLQWIRQVVHPESHNSQPAANQWPTNERKTVGRKWLQTLTVKLLGIFLKVRRFNILFLYALLPSSVYCTKQSHIQSLEPTYEGPGKILPFK